MPSLKRGFLFKYFDKIICGVIGLALLVGVAYALTRVGALPKDTDPAFVNENARVIEQKLGAPAQALNAEPLNVSELGKLPNPPAMRSYMMIWPLPVEYPPIKVGLNKEFTLQFKAPLGQGTVVVQAISPVIEIVAHPVDGDFSQVKARSKSYEGEAAVVGYEGRTAHIYPVFVDASVNKTAYPPALKVTSRQGTVALKLIPDAKIAAEEVQVTYFEIWRRSWSDPLGKYEVADEVDKTGKSLRSSTAAARGVSATTPLPTLASLAAATGRGTGKPAEPEVAGIAWEDGAVQPGEQYSYKARTVGLNTFPTEGDFCEPVMVEVLADIDFRFSFVSQDSVSFDVVKATGVESAQKKNFWVGIGDEIGGVPKGASAEDPYLTKDVLVDFHAAAVRPDKPGQTSRVIYADESGNLYVLWQSETKSDVLWDREKATSAPAPVVRPVGRPGPAGFMGPPTR
jgi:hypothetical protein